MILDKYDIGAGVAKGQCLVNVVPRLRAGRPDFDYRQHFSFRHNFQTCCGSSYLVITVFISSEVKRPECEADFSPFTTEIKSAWSCSSTPRTSAWNREELYLCLTLLLTREHCKYKLFALNEPTLGNY